MHHYLFKLKPEISTSKARTCLKKAGLEEMYFIEDAQEKCHFIGGFSALELPQNQGLAILVSKESVSIDWKKQSSEFSPYYKNGLIEFDLNLYGKNEILRLFPGEGFGDISHPTTQLMLEILPPYIREKSILDIGCGNGVLSLACKMLGSCSSIGVDIDQQAIKHAYNNLTLNNLNGIDFYIPEDLPDTSPEVILCNMTLEEQKIALLSYPQIQKTKTLILSGILKDQIIKALDLYNSLGFSTISKHEKDAWMALVIQKS